MITESEKKHFKIRVIIIGVIFILSLGLGLLVSIDTSPTVAAEENMHPIRERSCLGPPQFLPVILMGFPLAILVSILDIIVLAITKKLTVLKFTINIVLSLLFWLGVLFLYSLT